MKRILLRSGGKFTSRETIRTVAEHSPLKALSIPEMRQRVKLLDALDEATGDSLVIEDAEHVMLKQAIDSFPWQTANRDLLRIIDDILEPKEVSRAELRKVGSDAAEAPEAATSRLEAAE